MKKIILFFLIIASANAQKENAAAAQYVKSVNAYEADKLNALLTPDFKFSYLFAKAELDRKTFLEGFIPWSKLYHTHYEIIQTENGNPATYTVTDYNDYYKFLDVEPYKYKLIINTKDGKVAKVGLDSTMGYYKYIEKMAKKEAAFFEWKNYHYPDSEKDNSFSEKYYPQLKMYSELPEAERLVPEPEIGNSEFVDTVITEEPADTISSGAHEMTAEEIAQFDRDLKCEHRNKFTAVKRMSFYPFSKAKKIALISFSDGLRYSDAAVNTTNKIPDLSVATTVEILNKLQVDWLTDIIYNTGFTNLAYSVEEATPCPDLKNAIVFLDANNKPFEYLGLYFGCDIRELSSEKVQDGEYCTEKFDLLRQFFIAAGVPVGKLE